MTDGELQNAIGLIQKTAGCMPATRNILAQHLFDCKMAVVARFFYILFKRQTKRLFQRSSQIDYNHHKPTKAQSREPGSIEGQMCQPFSVEDRGFGFVCDGRCAS